MDELEISSKQLARITEHAEADLPQECCGILLGRRAGGAAHVENVLATTNVAPEPTSGYEIEPQALVSAHRRARAQGLEIVGYYHSHPAGEAIPSRRDREAAWSGTCYVIVATAGGAVSDWRSWHLGPGGRFVEQAVRLEEMTA